jgi:capsular exopolysaccharide synthesis family protein
MDPQLDEPDLRSYLGVVARRKWWVVGITAIFLALAVAMSVIPEPTYEVHARVLTSTGTDLATLVIGEGRTTFDVNREAENQAARIDGAEVRYRVARALPPSVKPGDVARVKVRTINPPDSTRTSSVVELSLVSVDPDQAAQLLRIYASTYVEYWNNLNQERTVTSMALLSDKITEIDGQIETANAEMLDPATDDNRRSDLVAEAARLRTQRGGWENQRDRLEVGAQTGDLGGAEVISPAYGADTPVTPDIPKNLAIGLSFGLFLGVTVAFLRDYFDDSVKSKEIVERVTGVPALGLIPRFDTSTSELVAAAAPTAAAAEAFRALRTSVKFLSVDREVRVVQITSPSPGEGKTVTAANLAIVLAQAGDRVVLVGADLRRPRAEELLGVPLTPGLTGVLIGEVALPQAIRSVEGLPNLSVLPAGYPPPNPSELLSGERARRLIDVLAQTYDIVILDCPPVLPVTDALVLARMADTTLLVTSVNRTSRRSLDRGVEVLQQVGAPLMGTVMTSLSPGATFGGEPYRYETTSYPRHKPQSPAFSGNGYGSAAPYASDASGQTSAQSSTAHAVIAPNPPPPGEGGFDSQN